MDRLREPQETHPLSLGDRAPWGSQPPCGSGRQR